MEPKTIKRERTQPEVNMNDSMLQAALQIKIQEILTTDNEMAKEKERARIKNELEIDNKNRALSLRSQLRSGFGKSWLLSDKKFGEIKTDIEKFDINNATGTQALDFMMGYQEKFNLLFADKLEWDRLEKQKNLQVSAAKEIELFKEENLKKNYGIINRYTKREVYPEMVSTAIYGQDTGFAVKFAMNTEYGDAFSESYSYLKRKKKEENTELDLSSFPTGIDTDNLKTILDGQSDDTTKLLMINQSLKNFYNSSEENPTPSVIDVDTSLDLIGKSDTNPQMAKTIENHLQEFQTYSNIEIKNKYDTGVKVLEGIITAMTEDEIDSGTKSQYLSLLSSGEGEQKSGKESSAFQYNDSQGKIEALRQVLHNNRRQSTNFANLDRAINNVILSVEQIQKKNSFKENLARSLDAGLNKTSNTGFLRNKVIGEVFGLSIGKDRETENESDVPKNKTLTKGGTENKTLTKGGTKNVLISPELMKQLPSSMESSLAYDFNKSLIGATPEEITEVNKYFETHYTKIASKPFDKIIDRLEGFQDSYNNRNEKIGGKREKMYKEIMDLILRDKIIHSPEYLEVISKLENNLNIQDPNVFSNFMDYVGSNISPRIFNLYSGGSTGNRRKVINVLSLLGPPVDKGDKRDYAKHSKLIKQLKEKEKYGN